MGVARVAADSRRRVDHWTHRQAIQIVAQLPEETEAALAVLDRARELLVCWESVGDLAPVRPRLIKAV